MRTLWLGCKCCAHTNVRSWPSGPLTTICIFLICEVRPWKGVTLGVASARQVPHQDRWDGSSFRGAAMLGENISWNWKDARSYLGETPVPAEGTRRV